MAKQLPHYNTGDLVRCLETRFPMPEWVLAHEVRLDIGPTVRSADAIAMNMWGSRGLRISGFELKRTRGDWLRELKQPDKAEAFFRRCNEWWLVTGHGVVKDIDEIPEGWGWLCMTNNKTKLIAKKKAPRRDSLKLDRVPVVQRQLMANMLRRVAQREARETEVIRREGYAKGYAAGKDGRDDREKRGLELRVQNLERQLESYQSSLKASGLDCYSRWEMPRIAAIVGMIHRIGVDRMVQVLRRLAERAAADSASLLQEIQIFEQATERKEQPDGKETDTAQP